MGSVSKRRGVRLPARAGIWGVASSLLSRGAGAIATPVFTRLLTPAEYGLYPLYTTWLGAVSAVVTLGLTSSAIYRGLQRYAGDERRFISAAMGLFFAFFIPLSAIILLASGGLYNFTGLPTVVVAMLLSEILFSTITAFSVARARYHYEYKTLLAINLIGAIGSPLIALLLIRLTPLRSEARILGSIITSLLVALPNLFILLARTERLYDREIWRYLLRVATPMVPYIVSTSLILRVGEMVIAAVHGDGALGRYSVGMSVGLVVGVVSGGIGSVTTPWLMRKITRGELSTIKRTVSTMVWIMSLSVMTLGAFGGEALAILTPVEYRDILPAVYPLLLISIFQFILGIVTGCLGYYEKSKRLSAISLSVALVTSALSILLIPRMDYRLTPFITLFGYMLLLKLSIRELRSNSGVSILRLRDLSPPIILAAASLAASYILHDAPLIRILLVLLILPLLIGTSREGIEMIREV